MTVLNGLAAQALFQDHCALVQFIRRMNATQTTTICKGQIALLSQNTDSDD